MDPLPKSHSGMDSSHPLVSNANLIPIGHHYLAQINYPTIPDKISIDRIFSVLQRIKMSDKPIMYSWKSLDRPKHGEIFLEQKFPLIYDSINGDQFPIVDDGYLWSFIPRAEIKEIQGRRIEIYRWSEGYAPGDGFFTVSKTEYRLSLPNNILFLVHYLHNKNPSVPIRPALPATKVSPTYLHQQYFQHVKQQSSPAAHQSIPQRSISPSSATRANASKPRPPSRMGPQPKLGEEVATATNATTTANTAAAATNPIPPVDSLSLDIFDGFDAFEAASYRYSRTRTLLNLITTTTTTSGAPATNSSSLRAATSQNQMEFETDFIEALKKKISQIDENMQKAQNSRSQIIQSQNQTSQTFWKLLSQLDQVSTEAELSIIQGKFQQHQSPDENNEPPHFISL